MKFTDFNLKDTIQAAVTEAGFTEPSPVQKDAIPLVLEGHDMIAQAQTGTGKTATVRKIGANSVGIERIFPIYSDGINEIKVIRRGRVRRAKLYYLRDLTGKKARIKEIRR